MLNKEATPVRVHERSNKPCNGAPGVHCAYVPSPELSRAFFPLAGYSRQTSSIPREASLLQNPAAARSLPGRAMRCRSRMKRILGRSPQDQ